MDANPCTKRIKDLQEQIHAWKFGLEDQEEEAMNKREGEKDARGKRREKRTRSLMDSNEDKYL